MNKALFDTNGGTEIQSGQVTVKVQVSAQYELN